MTSTTQVQEIKRRDWVVGMKWFIVTEVSSLLEEWRVRAQMILENRHAGVATTQLDIWSLGRARGT